MKTTTTLLIAASMALLPASLAAQASPFEAKLRLAHVSPDDSSSAIPGSGTRLAIGSDTSLEVALGYTLAPRWDVELSWLRTTLDTTASGPAMPATFMGAARADVVSFTAQYRPMTAGLCRPYLGLGGHLSSFSSFDPASALAASGLAAIELDDSASVTAQIGADFALNDRITINVDVKFHDIATDATLKLPSGSTFHTLRLDVDPWVFAVGAGYRF